MFTVAELEDVIPLVRSSVPPMPQYAWPLLKPLTGVEVVVKHENHTPIGAFKVRGGVVYFDRLIQNPYRIYECGYDYFNVTRNGKAGAVEKVEAWQILSPLRGMPFGVGDINRQIHERFRAEFMGLASRRPRSIPKPMGSDVYGDKVINLANHRRDRRVVHVAEGLGGAAEIGFSPGLGLRGDRGVGVLPTRRRRTSPGHHRREMTVGHELNAMPRFESPKWPIWSGLERRRQRIAGREHVHVGRHDRSPAGRPRIKAAVCGMLAPCMPACATGTPVPRRTSQNARSMPLRPQKRSLVCLLGESLSGHAPSALTIFDAVERSPPVRNLIN